MPNPLKKFPVEVTPQLERYFEIMKKYPQLLRQPEHEGGLKIFATLEEIECGLEMMRKQHEEKQRKKHLPPTPFVPPVLGLLVDDPWYYIVRDLVEFPNRDVGGYIRWINKKSLKNGVNVVMLTKRGEDFFLIEHYRHEERSFGWEFPRGFAEPGMSGEECARKEIDEELHIQDFALTELKVETQSVSGATGYYWIEIPEDAPIKVDQDEGVSGGVWLSRAELEDWIRVGKVNDPFTTKVYLYLLLWEKEH